MTVGVYALTGSDFISVSFKYIYFKPIVYQLVYPLSSVCQIYIYIYGITNVACRMCRLLDYCPSRAYVDGKAHRRGQYRFGSVTCHTGPQWPVPVTWLCMCLRSLTTGTTKRPSGVELLNDSFTTTFVELHRCPADPSERAHNLNCAFKRCLYCRRGRNVALQYESFESPCSPNTTQPHLPNSVIIVTIALSAPVI